MAGVPRFVQVSSAAVQGRTDVLDSSPNVAPFSPYSRSKALGALLARKAHPGTVEYRPPGVHGVDRRVSQMTARIARSRISSVARPGSSPSPQALLKNVADAIAFLATSQVPPPAIVAHPSEGLTTASVLVLLGRRQPLEIPRALAKSVVAMGMACGRVVPPVAVNTRRIEMLWFGQSQAPSWLTDAGWKPPAGQDAWKELGRLLAERSSGRNDSHSDQATSGQINTTLTNILKALRLTIWLQVARRSVVMTLAAAECGRLWARRWAAGCRPRRCRRRRAASGRRPAASWRASVPGVAAARAWWARYSTAIRSVHASHQPPSTSGARALAGNTAGYLPITRAGR